MMLAVARTPDRAACAFLTPQGNKFHMFTFTSEQSQAPPPLTNAYFFFKGKIFKSKQFQASVIWNFVETKFFLKIGLFCWISFWICAYLLYNVHYLWVLKNPQYASTSGLLHQNILAFNSIVMHKPKTFKFMVTGWNKNYNQSIFYNGIFFRQWNIT